LQDIKRSLQSESREQKEKNIENLVSKTTSMLENFAPDQLQSVVSAITSKIVVELQSDTQHRFERMQSSLKDSIVENSKQVDQLEQIIVELKSNQPLAKDPFNKTASFKLEDDK